MLLHQTPAGWFRFGAITLQLTRPVTHPCRAGSLPAVCRSFRRLLRGPSACLWPDISFSADISLPPQVQRTSNFLAWLRHHGRRCRQLQLDMWNGGLPPQALLAVRQLGLQLEDTLAGGCGGWVAGGLGGWVAGWVLCAPPAPTVSTHARQLHFRASAPVQCSVRPRAQQQRTLLSCHR